MHIKQIIIQGFKSYRDQVAIEPFDHRHNVIVGMNGSGKSNFFYAIQFVLSDRFTKLSPEERAKLLHEGVGKAVMSAFVEIIFDNKDRRLPIEKDEVSLKRTIGLKKDEFRFDGKMLETRDVMSILEAAGFSRSNPYYIVQQGKVNALVKMSETARLDLLKEVAGTNVYEARKEESLKIMQESKNQRAKIVDLLATISRRLEDLEKEKQDLREFQTLDRDRRAIEYTIYDKELADARSKLEQIEEQRAAQGEASATAHKEAAELKDKAKETERQLKALQTELRQLQQQRDQLHDQRQELVRQKTKVDLEKRDASDRAASDRSSSDSMTKELATLRERITKARTELDALRPRLQEKKKREADANQTLDAARREAQDLYSRQGRKQQFRTKEERDKWINSEIGKMTQTLDVQNRQIEELHRDMEESRERVESARRQSEELAMTTAEKKESVASFFASEAELRKKRDQLQNTRKTLWRECQDIEGKATTTKEQWTDSVKKLESTMPRSIAKGVQEMKAIAAKHGIQGLYGTIIELCEVDKALTTAVEVTAGNSLFNLVCDSADTASRLLDIFNKSKKEGRVTLMPLNQLRIKDKDMPRNDDVLPLISQLRFSAHLKPAFLQIFGKTLLARSLDIASDYSKRMGVDCVTVDGDQANKRGALTGGYHDTKFSRLEAMRTMRDTGKALEDLSGQHTKIKEQLASLDQEITETESKRSKLETQVEQLRHGIEREMNEAKELAAHRKSLEDSVQFKEESHARLLLESNRLKKDIESFRAELGTEMQTKLTAAEAERLRALEADVSKLEKQKHEAFQETLKTETEIKTIENLLSTNLTKREEELVSSLEQISAEGRGERAVESLSSELTGLEQQISEASSKSKALDKSIEESTTRVNKLKDELYDTKTRENEKERSLQDEGKALEKLLNERTIQMHKKEECIKKIKELGTLPSDVDRFKSESIKRLMDQLRRANEALKKLSHVNRKAIDQYVSFTNEREELTARLEELDKGAKAIQDLIEHLDHKKDEAIYRTFKQVNKNFEDVFKELVPGGYAQMVMLKERREEEMEEEESEEAESEAAASRAVRSYSGILFKVSFTGRGETQLLDSLSGGQKALVALTLIFAIQRSDPAPFYIFDEIDAALDEAYRTAVARMIDRMAEDPESSTQFITTTFKKEFVLHANKHYGVTFKNKVSSINVITRDEALAVIQKEEQRQERAKERRAEMEEEEGEEAEEGEEQGDEEASDEDMDAEGVGL